MQTSSHPYHNLNRVRGVWKFNGQLEHCDLLSALPTSITSLHPPVATHSRPSAAPRWFPQRSARLRHCRSPPGRVRRQWHLYSNHTIESAIVLPMLRDLLPAPQARASPRHPAPLGLQDGGVTTKVSLTVGNSSSVHAVLREPALVFSHKSIQATTKLIVSLGGKLF